MKINFVALDEIYNFVVLSFFSSKNDAKKII